MYIYCIFGFHDWDGCRCRNTWCGQTRDVTTLSMHDWDYCICKKCGKHRNESHDWNGCHCRKCNPHAVTHVGWSQYDGWRDCNHVWIGRACAVCHQFNGRSTEFDVDDKFRCSECNGAGHTLQKSFSNFGNQMEVAREIDEFLTCPKCNWHGMMM
jgi:hypothetical protein